MNNVEPLLAEAANAPQFNEAAHTAFLDSFENIEPDNVSLTTRFNAMNYLQRAIIHLAKKHDYKTVSPTDKNDFVVDESKFPREMALLLSLNSTVQYSDTLKKHFDSGRSALLKGLEAAPIFSVGADWEERTLEDKLDVLKRFIKRSIAAHCPFDVENDVICEADQNNSTGNFAFARQQYGRDEADITVDRTTVVFSRGVLANVYHAVRLAYHESIHICINRMAIAFANGTIAEDSDLYADAKLKMTAIAQDSEAIPVLHSHYMADAEEIVVYAEQEKFEEALDEADNHSTAPSTAHATPPAPR